MQEMIKENTIKKAPVPLKVRVLFEKTGSLQFISHLDLMRTMSRLVIRAGIGVYYTEGFNPRPKLVFALPLSVGAESVCELLDIKLDVESVDCEDILRRLCGQSVPELRFKSVYIPERKFGEIGFSEYEICIHVSGENASDKAADTADRIKHMCEAPVIVLKRTKSGESERDIRELIKSLDAYASGDKIIINAVLSADSENYLNPEYIVRAVSSSYGVPNGDISPLGDSYGIKRISIMDKNGEAFM